MDAEVRLPEGSPVRRGKQRVRDPARGNLQERKARPHGFPQLLSVRRGQGQLALSQGTGELYPCLLAFVARALANGTAGVKVEPVVSDLAPAGMRVDSPGRDLSRKRLYGSAGVVFDAEAGLHNGSGSQVFRNPAHARELPRRNGEGVPPARQLRLDLEASLHLCAVVFRDIRRDSGREVRERRGHAPVLGRLVPDEAARSFAGAVGMLRLVVMRRTLEFWCGVREEIVHAVSGFASEIIVHALFFRALSDRKVYEPHLRAPALQEPLEAPQGRV
ncbi:MAG: hypothetical protein M3151_11840, partial [Actinomycetota bacterium]|nr:hypothetical protein [Actinomycetota bacterium]